MACFRFVTRLGLVQSRGRGLVTTATEDPRYGNRRIRTATRRVGLIAGPNCKYHTINILYLLRLTLNNSRIVDSGINGRQCDEVLLERLCLDADSPLRRRHNIPSLPV